MAVETFTEDFVNLDVSLLEKTVNRHTDPLTAHPAGK